MRVQSRIDAFRTLTKRSLGKNPRADEIHELEHRHVRLIEEVSKGVALQEKTTRQADQIFTDDQIANLTGFFDVLKRIHTRLAIEGYVITPGGIQAPTTRSLEAESALAIVPTT